MSLQDRLAALIAAIGADIKSIKSQLPSIPTVIPGVAGDGVTDDTSAINAALATAGGNWLLESGKTYLHKSVLQLTAANVTLTGYNALLVSDSATSCGLHITGVNAKISGVVHRNISGNTSRSGDNFNVCPFSVDATTGTTLTDCVSENSPAAGFFFSTASNFVSRDCVVRYSLADGHHVTNGSINGSLIRPIAEFVGDDMFANVSYVNEAVQVTNIRWVSPRGFGQANSGRGFTVVGASFVYCDDLDVSDTYAAGIYVAAETGAFNTKNTSNVFINGGKVTRPARLASSPGDDAILLYVAASGQTVTNVYIRNIGMVDGGHIKAGNNNAGKAGNSFSNCVVQAVLSGRIDGTAAYADSDIGVAGANGVTFTYTIGGQWGLTTADPITAYLAADYTINSTSSGNPSGAFNMNYLGPGTYEFEIEGAYQAVATTTKPVMNFGNNQGAVLGVKYEFYTGPANAVNAYWVTSSNGTASPANTLAAANTAYPFRVKGVVVFSQSTGNNVWAFQVASSVANSAVVIKAGTKMVLRRFA